MLQVQGLFTLLMLAGVTLVSHAPANAQSLDEVLSAVEQDSEQMSARDAERIAHFERERDLQAEIVAAARAELEIAEARGEKASADFDWHEDKLEELSNKLMQKATAYGEMLGQMRVASSNAEGHIASSLSSFEYPGRAEEIKRVAEARTLPTRADLDVLPNAMLTEMRAQSEVKRFTANVVHASTDGAVKMQELIRVGTFQAVTVDTAEFVIVQKIGRDYEAERVLVTFPGQPEEMRAGMRALIEAEEGEIVRAPIDASNGRIFVEGVFGPRD